MRKGIKIHAKNWSLFMCYLLPFCFGQNETGKNQAVARTSKALLAFKGHLIYGVLHKGTLLLPH